MQSGVEEEWGEQRERMGQPQRPPPWTQHAHWCVGTDKVTPRELLQGSREDSIFAPHPALGAN